MKSFGICFELGRHSFMELMPEKLTQSIDTRNILNLCKRTADWGTNCFKYFVRLFNTCFKNGDCHNEKWVKRMRIKLCESLLSDFPPNALSYIILHVRRGFLVGAKKRLKSLTCWLHTSANITNTILDGKLNHYQS